MKAYGSFRKLGVPYFGVLVVRIPTIYGTILGSPIFGNSQITLEACFLSHVSELCLNTRMPFDFRVFRDPASAQQKSRQRGLTA